jgi:tripartite-type tricarboxylate transporter receptor subunit TctC
MGPLTCRTLAALSWLAVFSPAAAQDYPTRPITIVVPYTPGGSTEILSRFVGQKLEERLGKSVVIENKPGAGTVIGSSLVAKSAPDGYTLMMATPTPMAINVMLHKQLPYDPATDLIPLVMVAGAPFVLVVNAALPIHSVKEFIAYAKERPGQLSYGSGGPGAPHHLYAELLASMTGIKMTHVPYKGTLPALNDVVAGHIPVMFSDIPPLVGVMPTGKVRPLGVSTKARVAAFPDVPPLNEAGVPGFDVAGWFMLVAQGKTPAPIVDKLHRELKAVMAMPEVKAQIAKLSLLPMDTPPVAEMQSYVKSEIVRWGKVVEAAGIARSQ